MRRPPRSAGLLALVLACTPPQPAPEATTTAPAAPPVAPVDLPPPPTITIHVDAPGRSAEEVDRSIAAPLAHAVAAVADVRSRTAASRPDRAELELTLDAAADPPLVQQAVRARLAAVAADLPADVTPVLGYVPDRRIAVTFTLQSDRASARELREIGDSLRDEIFRTPGVADVDMCGGRSSQLRVTLDPARLSALGLTLAAVADAVRGHSTSGSGAPDSVEDLASLALRPGEPLVRLRDVASVASQPAPADCDVLRLGGGPAVLGVVHARRGVVPSEFDTAVRAAIAARTQALPPHITLAVPAAPSLRISLELAADPDGSLVAEATRLAGALAPHARHPMFLRAEPPPPGATRRLAELFVTPDGLGESAALRGALDKLPGVLAIGTPADRLADPNHRVVHVLGPDPATAERLAGHVVMLARNTPGVAHAAARGDRVASSVVRLDRDAIARRGASPDTIRDVLAAALGELRVGTMHAGDATLPVIMAIGEPDGTPGERMARALGVTVPSATVPTPIQEFVTLDLVEEPFVILRRDDQRVVEVDLRYRTPAAPGALQKAVATGLELPPGYTVVWD
jgi:multidrug efflux pump subunit AcrB